MSAASYGLLAEFAGPEELTEAARLAYDEGYRRLDAYSPMPIEGLSEALGFHRTWMPMLVLLGGISGGFGGYLLQYWVATIAYPLNVGGRPLHSWPSFIPVTFEMTILVASLAGVLGMLALCGLPRPHHPLFAIPQFARASRNGFFLCIEASDPRFHDQATRELLIRAGATEVLDVPN